MIQNGQMSRAEALENARRYDDEYPKQFLTENLDYLGLDEMKFTEIVDKHRNSEIWKFEGNQWKLRYPPQ